MGKRGPRPANNHLKVLRGDKESRLNRDEAIPEDGDVIPPEDISEGALEIWDRLAPDMIDKKVLTKWDVEMFAAFCEAVATYHECKALMGKNYTDRGAAGGVIKSPYWQIMRDCLGVMKQFSGLFGLSPGDRANLVIGADDDTPTGGAERILG